MFLYLSSYSIKLNMVPLSLSASLGSKAECTESFTPCSCYQSPWDDTIEVSCFDRTVQAIQDLFSNRTSDIEVLLIYGLQPNEMNQGGNMTVISLPVDWLSSTRAKRIEIRDYYFPSIPGLELKIHQDAFRASKDYLEWFQIGDFVFVGNVNFIVLDRLDFSFLTGFTQLNTLVVMDSPDFRRFNNIPPLPNLKTVYVNWCPSFKQWDGQVDNTGLESINLDYNYFDDITIENIINSLAMAVSAGTLRSLSLVGLDSETERPSRLPKMIASSFPLLNSLDVSYNQIKNFETGSLGFSPNQQIAKINLQGNRLENIEPGAFEGDFSNAKIFMGYNNLPRLDSDVFKKMLEQMVTGIGNIDLGQYAAASKLIIFNVIENVVFIFLNLADIVECGDCSLAWLIRDNRPLLRPILNGGCNNGSSFINLDPNGYNDCPPT